MSAGERFKSWIDATFSSWGDRLASWGLSMLARGATRFTEDMEPAVKESARSALAGLLANPVTPEEIKDKIRAASDAGNILETIYLEFIMILQSFGVILGGSTPVANEMRYAQDYVKRSSRLDPLSVINAWRRDPEAYAKYFDDLREQGWSDDRIEAIKFVTQFMPTPQDLVNWEAKEVFEPEMIARYGLDSEFGGLDLTLFEKIGVTPEQALNYWRAHWEHPALNTIIEMLRRTDFSEEDFRDWFKLVEIPPYWRDKLIEISWNVPTRVDVRRFWDMRTIDEVRLREIYTAQGYHGKDLEDYVLWTKIYVDFPDLMTRYKNGWLTLEDVRTELKKLGMSAERAEELIQTKVKAVASEALVKQRDLTMSQIVKGVKKAVISREEGGLLLQDMGYDPYEAEYILAIEIPQDEVVTEVKIRELTKADILSGLKNEVIGEPEAMTRLLGLRYLPDDAEFILSIYRATISPPEDPRLREASKADIVKAVKAGLITPEDGYLMLIDIGFSPAASEFILMVQAETSPFSPMSFNEFKSITDQYKQVVGRGGPEMPDEIKKAAAEVVRLTAEVDNLKEAIVREEAALIPDDTLPPEATTRLKELQVFKNRAEAELARITTDYNILVSEWRQKE